MTGHMGDDPGSSPRVRGRQRQPGCVHPGHGLIPASAGQTGSPLYFDRQVRAHPRECGADFAKEGKDPQREGSSPRVRGRLCYTL